jgi:integrase
MPLRLSQRRKSEKASKGQAKILMEATMASIRKRKWKNAKGVEREAWVVDYVDQKGERALKTFATKKEAETWSVHALHEVQQGIHTRASASKTIAEAWTLWIEQSEADGLERSTVCQRQQHLKYHVKNFIGDIRLSELSTPAVYDFDAKLRQAGRSVAMRRKVLTNLKTMLGFAQGRGLVAQNVARGVRIKSDDRESTSGPLRAGVDFPSVPELNLLIDNARPRWRPFIVTAIFTGMRLSELRGLRWSDVDLETGIIHVRQRANVWGQMGSPKSKAGKRDIPLAPIVVNALRQWREVGPKSHLDLVFATRDGKPQLPSALHHSVWVPLLIKCGLTAEDGSHRYHFHLLRHAAASLFIAYLKWPPQKVKTVMGHAKITMTFDLYGHLFESVEADREDMKRLEAAVRVA